MMKVISFLVVLVTMLMTTTVQSKILIKIDLDSQRLSATKASGEMVVWKISSGRSGYETPIGHFSVMRMEKDHHSDEYDQAPMPYALFFSPRGLAIHGTFEKGLGRPASHGCVRLAVPHAQQLFSWVEEEGGAQVEYEDQDPRIHRIWLGEIAQHGVESRMGPFIDESRFVEGDRS